jgi:transcriptional regulator with XRE-family HTH domain
MQLVLPFENCLRNRMVGIYAHMNMPERSFGRTVRYRRTKLGLSQAQLAELVGRSAATVRAWERDKSRPNDAKVLSALAAILGVSERQLFEKAEVEQPAPAEETSPTVEQALATLGPVASEDEATPAAEAPIGLEPEEEAEAVELEVDLAEEAEPVSHVPEPEPDDADARPVTGDADVETIPDTEVREPVGAVPAFTKPPDRYVTTPITPALSDLSYMEDRSQRQLYRVRTLATLVVLVALVVAFIWSLGESLGALGDWWDQFFGNLRL